MKNKTLFQKIKPYLLVHLILFVYALGSICSKTAAQKPLFSLPFFFFYGLVLLNLAVYAVLWQQVLKMLPLHVAFANKAVTVLWGILFGALFFHETVTPKMLIGAALVMIGVVLSASLEGGKDDV